MLVSVVNGTSLIAGQEPQPSVSTEKGIAEIEEVAQKDDELGHLLESAKTLVQATDGLSTETSAGEMISSSKEYAKRAQDIRQSMEALDPAGLSPTDKACLEQAIAGIANFEKSMTTLHELANAGVDFGENLNQAAKDGKGDQYLPIIEKFYEAVVSLDSPASTKSELERVEKSISDFALCIDRILNIKDNTESMTAEAQLEATKIDEFSILQYADEVSRSLSSSLESVLGRCIEDATCAYELFANTIPTMRQQDSTSLTPNITIAYELEKEAYPNLYYATNSIVRIKAHANVPEQEVLISVEVPGFTNAYEQKVTIGQNLSYLTIKPTLLDELPDPNTQKDTSLNFKMTDVSSGKVLVQETASFTRWPVNDWNYVINEEGETSMLTLLAWLNPEADVMDEIKRKAVEYLEEDVSEDIASLPGYQSLGLESYCLLPGESINTMSDEQKQAFAERARRVNTLVQVAAIQKAISDLGVRYVMDGYSLSGRQNIKDPEKVMESKQGLCVETSLLMASCLLSAGMHPLLVLTPGHCQVAVETWDGGKQYVLVETTVLPYDGLQSSVASDGKTQGIALLDQETYGGLVPSVTINGKKCAIEDSDTLLAYMGQALDGVNSKQAEICGLLDCGLRETLNIHGVS